ncbi:nucleic-acid-binding protein from transposon X-element [Trichonephila clavipes]|nr:nucleic-acid-binding protein from transposon X-element [Trichonephila clavipes]
MQFLAEEVIFVFDEINFLNLTLARMNASKYRKSSRNLEQTQKKAEEQGRLAEQLKGELLSLGSCPIQDCPTHSNLNATQVLIQKKEDALKLQILLATNISKSNNNVTENNIPKSQETKKKTNRVEGFTSPVKTAKKQKILQNYSIGVDAPINVQNKFNVLAGSSAMPVSVNAAVPVATPKPPKIPFIHLKFTDNYNLVMQAITRKWPKSRSKLSGEYLKILASTADEHREITAFLKEKGEGVPRDRPIEVRPRRYRPAHEVENQNSNSPSFGGVKEAPRLLIFSNWKHAVFLSVKIDSFNRRPGATQCYNCNLFHHSSSNCNIKTRCLKCGEPHKTGDCPIKTKIENPTCINCQQKGHLANSHRCPKFPKPKPKKGEASQNRNSKKENNNHNIFSTSSATVQKGVSFAKALSNDKENQMAPPLDQTEPAKSKPEATPNPPPKEKSNKNSPKNVASENFGFMDAILELKKFFTDYPSLLELGRQLRAAQGNERVDVFYRHLISLN